MPSARAGRGRWFANAGWARAWTAAWLVLPLPLLFHGPFREGVIRPRLD